MDVPASQPAVSAEEEFAIDEAFECDAPTYAEFPDALHDMSNVDSWFDRKTWDDVSPEVDEDAWCEDETLSCPQTPSSNYSARSATATPIKPVAWMNGVDERSPQREDDMMGRHVQLLLQTKSPIQPAINHGTNIAPVLYPQSPSRQSAPMPMLSHQAQKPKIAEPKASICTTTAQSTSKNVPAPTTKKTLAMPVPPTTLGKTEKPSKTVPSSQVRKPLSERNINIVNQSKSSDTTTIQKSVVKTATQKRKEPPVKSQPYASQRNVIAPLRTINGQTGPVASKEPTLSTDENKAQPRFMAPTKSALARTQTQPSLNSQPTSQATSTVQKPTLNRTTSASGPRLQAVSKPPLKSFREKHFESNALTYQAKMVAKLQNRTAASSSTGSRQQQSPAHKPIRQMSVKATPNSLRVLRDQTRRPLTVAVTPEWVKRSTHRIREEPRLTSEQREALEAERKRREFWQAQHAKNVNRGFAPRIHYETQAESRIVVSGVR